MDSGLELDDMFLHSDAEAFSDGDLDGVRGIDARHGTLSPRGCPCL